MWYILITVVNYVLIAAVLAAAVGLVALLIAAKRKGRLAELVAGMARPRAAAVTNRPAAVSLMAFDSSIAPDHIDGPVWNPANSIHDELNAQLHDPL